MRVMKYPPEVETTNMFPAVSTAVEKAPKQLNAATAQSRV